MRAKRPLSPAQLRVLHRLAETGMPLERNPKGTWHTKGTPEVQGERVWTCQTQPVKVLERRGLVARRHVLEDARKDERALTPAGLNAAQAAVPSQVDPFSA